jgi:hypothetical protein
MDCLGFFGSAEDRSRYGLRVLLGLWFLIACLWGGTLV